MSDIVDTRNAEALAYAAALWAAVFAAFHIIWAAGWYPLLDAAQARIAFATPWKWTYDVVVAAVCVIAVPVALAPVMSWGRYVPRRLTFTHLAHTPPSCSFPDRARRIGTRRSSSTNRSS